MSSQSGAAQTVRHSLHEVWHAAARGAQVQAGVQRYVQSAPTHESVQESWFVAAQLGTQSGTASQVVVQPCAVSPAANAHTAGGRASASGDAELSGAGPGAPPRRPASAPASGALALPSLAMPLEQAPTAATVDATRAPVTRARDKPRAVRMKEQDGRGARSLTAKSGDPPRRLLDPERRPAHNGAVRWPLPILVLGWIAACHSPPPAAPSAREANETVITVEDESGAPYELEELLIGIDGNLAYRWSRGAPMAPVHRTVEPGLHTISAKVTMRVRCGLAREPHGAYALHTARSVRVDRRAASLTLTLFSRDLVSPPQERLGLALRGDGILIDAPYAVLPAVADLCAPLPPEERVECRVRAAMDLARQQRDVVRLNCAEDRRRALEHLTRGARTSTFGADLRRIDADLGACIAPAARDAGAPRDVWEETARCAEDPDPR